MFEIPKQPPSWQFWLARLFGRKLTPWSHYWRGKYWSPADAPLNISLSDSKAERIPTNSKKREEERE